MIGATIEPGVFIASGAQVRNGETIAENSTVGEIPKSFFQDVFNLPDSEDVRAKAAENYSKFLRKTHAQDAVAEAPKKAAPKASLRKTEEPPPTQSTEVEKVVDVMFVELEEARLRREAAIEREKKTKR